MTSAGVAAALRLRGNPPVDVTAPGGLSRILFAICLTVAVAIVVSAGFFIYLGAGFARNPKASGGRRPAGM